MSKKTLHIIAIPLLMAGFVPAGAVAAPAGVGELLTQAKYWQGKGRGDLARKAYNRVLTIDPANKEARAGLSGGAPAKPQPVPQRVAPVKAPQAVASAPVAPRKAVVAPRPVADRSGAARLEGFRALDAGQLKIAGTRFTSALSANPSDADALGGLGIVRLRESRFSDARDLLSKASSLGSPAKWAEALDAARFYAGMDAARSALAAGKADQAEKLAQALAASSFADRDSAKGLLASIYEQQGRHTEAADLYRQLGDKGGATNGGAAGNALRNQAMAALNGGDAVEAERLLREGMGVSSADPWISYDLANLLIQQGRPSEADALVRSLAYSDDPQPLYAAALILNKSGRTADAAAVMGRIAPGRRTQEMRNFASGLDVLGTIQQAKVLAGRGAQGHALASLRQAADARGLSVDRMGALAQAMLDLGDTMGAAQVARNAVNAPATDAGSYDAVVRVLAKTGQDSLAMTTVQKATAMAGSSIAAKNGIADLNATLAVSQAERLRQTGQFAAAFDTLQGAWNAAPGNVGILVALGQLYQSGGMHGQAVQAYRMALADNPTDKAVLIGLIDAASSAGDTRTAKDTTVLALRAHPDDHEIYMAASRMAQARGDYSQAVKYMKVARTLYLQKTNGASTFSSGNPFVGMQQGNNPFRAMPQQQQMANPFALGSGPVPIPVPVEGGRTPAYSPIAYNAPAVPAFGGGEAPVSDFGDPVLAEMDRQLQDSQTDSGPRVDVDTGYRSRTGETGLSRLSEISGSATASTDLAHGRVGLTARAVSLDSGRPTGSSLARFGTNATAEALGIVAKLPSVLAQADTQHASGVEFTASYESDLIKASVGSTPLGFSKSHITGHAEIRPRLSVHSSARIWADRAPVTDSIVSYAGTSDPRTGLRWGAVMKTGGGVSLSYDRDGNGVYADASYSHYDGTAVRDNEGIQANVGGYLRAWQDAHSNVSVGFNANFQNFDNNQNYFTYGHGGYFSPQSFISINFPVRYAHEKDGLKVSASVAPGHQSYDQQSEALYPTEGGAQGVLDYLKTQNSDVRSRYDSASKTGFGMAASASAYYSLSPSTRVGGDMSLNTFGEYKEFKTLVGIRQQIGGK
jgi:tetratricopeptide (TPR) repeat protein